MFASVVQYIFVSSYVKSKPPGRKTVSSKKTWEMSALKQKELSEYHSIPQTQSTHHRKLLIDIFNITVCVPQKVARIIFSFHIFRSI